MSRAMRIYYFAVLGAIGGLLAWQVEQLHGVVFLRQPVPERAWSGGADRFSDRRVHRADRRAGERKLPADVAGRVGKRLAWDGWRSRGAAAGGGCLPIYRRDAHQPHDRLGYLRAGGRVRRGDQGRHAGLEERPGGTGWRRFGCAAAGRVPRAGEIAAVWQRRRVCWCWGRGSEGASRSSRTCSPRPGSR